jgi:hypothetical protein
MFGKTQPTLTAGGNSGVTASEIAETKTRSLISRPVNILHPVNFSCPFWVIKEMAGKLKRSSHSP